MTSSFGTTVGFDSIAVALLARSHPLAIVLAALLFGAMRAGAGLMQIQAQIPVELVDVLQAVDPAVPRRESRPAPGPPTPSRAAGVPDAEASMPDLTARRRLR